MSFLRNAEKRGYWYGFMEKRKQKDYATEEDVENVRNYFNDIINRYSESRDEKCFNEFKNGGLGKKVDTAKLLYWFLGNTEGGSKRRDIAEKIQAGSFDGKRFSKSEAEEMDRLLSYLVPLTFNFGKNSNDNKETASFYRFLDTFSKDKEYLKQLIRK